MPNSQVRVNIRTAVNKATIRKETRAGREVIIVPSATLPDNVVMNGIRYPAAEIAKSFKTLNRTPAPLGHPTVNGSFISASDPEGLARGWIGAWNENVRQEGGRVLLDKVIDVQVANQSEGGQRVLKAIEGGDAIHTSTGLLMMRVPLKNAADGASYEARDMVFDHDAILLDEAGAATPDQGVGMLVNKAVGNDGQSIEVINSVLDDAERELDWAADSVVRAAERMARVPVVESVKRAIMEMVRGAGLKTEVNKEDESMSDAQLTELGKKIDGLAESITKGVGDAVANAVTTAMTAALAPVIEANKAAADAQKAKDDEEKKKLADKVVGANLLSEVVANSLTIDALRELAKKAEPGTAANVFGGFTPVSNNEGTGFQLPKSEG